MMRIALFILIISSFVCASPKAEGVSDAISLKQALEIASENNPTLQEARAVYYGVAENLGIAISGYRPTINLNASVTNIETESEGNNFITQDGGNFSESANIEAQQPLFRGGKTSAETRQAKNAINAQYWLLKSAYQDVFQSVTQNYWDLYLQSQILNLNLANRDLLEKQLEETQARFDAGELTLTDVSQSRARLAEGQALIASTRSSLRQVQARLEQLLRVPVVIEEGKPFLEFLVPETIDQGLEIALEKNPNAVSARYLHNAKVDDVNSIIAELLPQITLVAQAERQYNPPPGFLDEQNTETIQLNATLPLYQGGATRARARQAKYAIAENKANIVETEEAVRAEVLSTWEEYQALDFQLEAREEQIKAARVALEGATEETRYGLRTFIDRLDAQQELLSAETNYAQAERDSAIAKVNLAVAMGIFTPHNIGLENAQLPDNEEVMNKIGSNWLGLDVDYVE